MRFPTYGGGRPRDVLDFQFSPHEILNEIDIKRTIYKFFQFSPHEIRGQEGEEVLCRGGFQFSPHEIRTRARQRRRPLGRRLSILSS